MTHSGHGKFELGSHITTQVYAYKTVKYHHPLPKELTPVTPRQLLKEISDVAHAEIAKVHGSPRRGHNVRIRYASCPPQDPKKGVLKNKTGVIEEPNLLEQDQIPVIKSTTTTTSTTPSTTDTSSKSTSATTTTDEEKKSSTSTSSIPTTTTEDDLVKPKQRVTRKDKKKSSRFDTRVSFDTVNIQYISDPASYTDDSDDYDSETGMHISKSSKTKSSLLDGGWGPKSGGRDPSSEDYKKKYGAAPRRSTSPELSPTSGGHRRGRSSSAERSLSPGSSHGGRLHSSLSPVGREVANAVAANLRKQIET
ncbi:unnamed protein product [Ambrosiozyma monospora]|uniref:Unnamed protein product n=1 Tax=Ambrosiozyma monospora TaxID=43982 RepID=A0ACB5TNQ2_AMBMO|nr:unnamed protein product [Ambrosiozyma monospora]